MRFSKHIKNLSGIFITCLFLLAISPKQYVHLLFANHTDSTKKIISTHGANLSVAGYNCNVDQLVVECNFEAPSIASPIYLKLYPSFNLICNSSLYFFQPTTLKDRGPPASI